MWNLKNKPNGQTKQTHRYKEQIGGRQKGGSLDRWTKWVKGIKKYKLPVKINVMDGNSLTVQWLSLPWVQGSVPGDGTKIPRAMQHSLIK